MPERLPQRGDPTDRGQAEQRLADDDQRRAEDHSRLVAREQELADAEQADADAGEDRPVGAWLDDVRIRRARERMRIADARDAIADARDAAAAERDALAAERDADAGIRDQIRARMQRDTLEPGHPLIELADREQLLVGRDRRAGAAERADAAADRRRSAHDRQAAARVRAEAMRHREAAYRAKRSAAFDPLTGARHRDLGLRDLEAEIGRSRREDRLVVAAVVVVDADGTGTPEANAAHDAVLVAVGEAIHRRLRSHDLVARWDDDGFLCAFAGLALTQAEERFAAIAAELADGEPASSIRVGYAQLRPDDTAADVSARAAAAVGGHSAVERSA